MGLKVNNNELIFDDDCRISFQRTIRIPDDGKVYPLPPSLGLFPVCRVDDYSDKVPEEWKKHGGVFLPMYQREAMWIQMNAKSSAPKAVKCAVGKVNAISGETWTSELKSTSKHDDYMVIPDQPWLDGINSGNGMIKQFVAMPLGGGYTVEAQVTGEEKFGGIQLVVYNMKNNPKPVKRKIEEYAWKPVKKSTAPVLPNPAEDDEEDEDFTHVNPYAPPKPINPYIPPVTPYAPMQYRAQNNIMYGNAPMQAKGSLFCSTRNDKPVSKEKSTKGYSNRSSNYNDFSYGKVKETTSLSCSSSVFDDASGFLTESKSVPTQEFQQMEISSKPRREQRQRLEDVTAKEMGLSAGGKMKQKIYRDKYGVDSWDSKNPLGRVYVHIVNSAMYKQITGKNPPPTPIDASTYECFGYKWFDIYDEYVPSAQKSNILSNVKSVKEIDQQKYGYSLQNDKTVNIEQGDVITFKKDKDSVRDGDW